MNTPAWSLEAPIVGKFVALKGAAITTLLCGHKSNKTESLLLSDKHFQFFEPNEPREESLLLELVLLLLPLLFLLTLESERLYSRGITFI